MSTGTPAISPSESPVVATPGNPLPGSPSSGDRAGNRARAHLRLVDPELISATDEVAGHGQITIDPAVIASAARGDERSFTEIVRQYHPRFLRFARHMVRDFAEAEDAVQEAFIRIHRALPSYQEQSKFESWLFRILANCCRTTLARNRTRSFRLIALGDQDAREAYTSADARNDVAWRSLLATALEQLPVDQREAFLLHYVEGYSYDAMVEMTGVGLSALKMRVKRACDKMWTLLGEDRSDA